MNGAWYMALRHALHHRALSVILVLCIGVTVFLPVATAVLTRWYASELVARADQTPLVAGPAGNRFDLTLSALYWRRSGRAATSMAELRSLEKDVVRREGIAVPLHARFTAQGVSVVAVAPEYFTCRRAAVAQGDLPARIGEATIGAAAARRLRLGVGGTLFSDQIDAFDLSRPPALKMKVVGVLTPTHGPDDDAVFVDLKTAWILEGLAHGHVDPVKGVPERLVLEKNARTVRLSEELIEYNEVTDANIESFHLHAEDSMLPLTAVLIFPSSEKGATLIKARAAVSKGAQVVVPREVIDELLAIVGRAKAVLGVFFGVLGASTLALLTLVGMLSVRVRAREIETLHKIGCGRWFVAKLMGAELLLIVLAGMLLAAGALAAGAWSMPSLVRLVQAGAPVGNSSP